MIDRARVTSSEVISDRKSFGTSSLLRMRVDRGSRNCTAATLECHHQPRSIASHPPLSSHVILPVSLSLSLSSSLSPITLCTRVRCATSLAANSQPFRSFRLLTAIVYLQLRDLGAAPVTE